jgi:hypothetical protein
MKDFHNALSLSGLTVPVRKIFNYQGKKQKEKREKGWAQRFIKLLFVEVKAVTSLKMGKSIRPED